MRVIRVLGFLTVVSILASCASATSPGPMDVGTGRDGLAGWNILSPDYVKESDVDMLSFEWDYFMVHDEGGRFTGSIGYLIANPRNSGAGGLGDLVPKGGNVAVAGMFDGKAPVAEYRNFGLDGFQAGATERSFSATDAATGQSAKMTPVRAAGGEPDHLLLEGRTANFEWSLTVREDWPALSGGTSTFSPMQGTDVGTFFPGEVWNVNMLWPRTRVEGSITRTDTKEVFLVSGHGYRENSWGRWAFNLGGWDFAVVSDVAANVAWAWQSYHPNSVMLDYLDLGFVENGKVVLQQFKATAGELGWSHGAWKFDPVARQCMPQDTTVRAQNATYRVEAQVTLGADQVPMLSDATEATKAFVIEIQFPKVAGTLTRRDTGAVVATFSGQGGGEFSNLRASVDAMSDADCDKFGAAFASPMPW